MRRPVPTLIHDRPEAVTPFGAAADALGAQVVGPVVVAEQLPPAAVHLPGGQRRVLGPQLHPGPVQAVRPPGSWPAATPRPPRRGRPPPPARPGAGRPPSSRVPATRRTNPVQLSPPGAMGRSGSVSQSGLPNRSLNADQSRPSASPGWSSQNPHSSTTAAGAGRPSRRRHRRPAPGPGSPPSRPPGAGCWRTGRRHRPARRSRPAGPRSTATWARPRSVRPGAADRAAAHARHVAHRLAVADQHDRGGRRRASPPWSGCRAAAPRATGPRGRRCPRRSGRRSRAGARRTGHASSPTNRSSWRRVRHSTTSSQ